MFATAVRLLGRKLGPKPIKLANLGENAQSASQTLTQILEQHGPLTVTDCWNHASQVENTGLKSKRHMKMMLRWMRERRQLKVVCNHGGDGKHNPNDKEFLFSVALPKVQRPRRTTTPDEPTLEQGAMPAASAT